MLLDCTTKICKRCGEEKPLSAFHPSKSCKDGHERVCYVCRREMTRIAKEATHESLPYGHRRCSKCKNIKPLEAFVTDPKCRGGYTFQCKDCARDYFAEWRVKNPDKTKAARQRQRAYMKAYSRKWKLASKYNLTLDDYSHLLAFQSDNCPICHATPSERTFHVDHNRDTGEVRGILCGPCNQAIGLLRHDLELLAAASAYLANPPARAVLSK